MTRDTDFPKTLEVPYSPELVRPDAATVLASVGVTFEKPVPVGTLSGATVNHIALTYTPEQNAKIREGLTQLDPNITAIEPKHNHTGKINPSLSMDRNVRVAMWRDRYSVTCSFKPHFSSPEYYFRFSHMVTVAEVDLYKVRSTDEDKAFCELNVEKIIKPAEAEMVNYPDHAMAFKFAASPVYVSPFKDNRKCEPRAFAWLIWNGDYPHSIYMINGEESWTAILSENTSVGTGKVPTHLGVFKR